MSDFAESCIGNGSLRAQLEFLLADWPEPQRGLGIEFVDSCTLPVFPVTPWPGRWVYLEDETRILNEVQARKLIAKRILWMTLPPGLTVREELLATERAAERLSRPLDT